MNGWMEISTAPKDGTAILVFDVSESYGQPPVGATIMVVKYYAYHPQDYRAPGGVWEAPYGPCRAHNPTHWCPLPPPPKEINK